MAKVFFKIREAAEYAGTNRMSLYRRFKTGELRAERNPFNKREKLLAKDELDRYLKTLPGGRFAMGRPTGSKNVRTR